MSTTLRARRSCLAVPGSSQKFIDKARTLNSDQVFLDLEDACARWPSPVRGRRSWRPQRGRLGREDPRRPGQRLDHRVDLPRRDRGRRGRRREPRRDHAAEGADPQQVVALDLLLTQIEKTNGLEVGKIGIEAQIENALGLTNVNTIATASPRVETIIFGPADFMASINMKSLVVGEQPPATTWATPTTTSSCRS